MKYVKATLALITSVVDITSMMMEWKSYRVDRSINPNWRMDSYYLLTCFGCILRQLNIVRYIIFYMIDGSFAGEYTTDVRCRRLSNDLCIYFTKKMFRCTVVVIIIKLGNRNPGRYHWCLSYRTVNSALRIGYARLSFQWTRSFIPIFDGALFQAYVMALAVLRPWSVGLTTIARLNYVTNQPANSRIHLWQAKPKSVASESKEANIWKRKRNMLLRVWFCR